MTKLLSKIIILTLILCASLLITEVILRNYDDLVERIMPGFQFTPFHPFMRISENPNLVYELTPNQEMYEDSQTGFTTNWLGLRSPNISLEKPGDTYRIALIGDSVAYGMGVTHEKRFSELLEKQLNANNPLEKKLRYEVINAAVPGYNFIQSASTYFAKLNQLKPDLLIVALTDDDANPSYLPSFQHNQPGIFYGLHNYLIETLYSYRVIFTHLYLRFLLEPSKFNDSMMSLKQAQQACLRLQEDLLDRCKKDLVQVMVLYNTTFGNSEEDDYIRFWETKFNDPHVWQFAIRSEILRQEPLAKDGRLNIEGPQDAHFNEKGHRLVAKILYAELKKRLNPK